MKTQTKKQKFSKKTRENSLQSAKSKFTKIAIYVSLWAVLLTSLIFSNYFDNLLNAHTLNLSEIFKYAPYKVHFIDVGQGDCILFELPDGKTALIDSGPSTNQEDVLCYFDALKITKIDHFILTHTDSDHTGNAEIIFENYDIYNVYIPKIYSVYEVENNLSPEDYNVVETQVWSSVTQKIHMEETLATTTYNFRDVTITGTGYSFAFYSPFVDNISNVNNYCPVIILTILGTKYIFTGDSESSVENNFLSTYSENGAEFFDCDVLKVGHHGSNSSTSDAFLSAITPKVAVISVGADNAYSHPRDEVLSRLNEYDCDVLRTDQMGSIVLTTYENQIVSQSGQNPINSTRLKWESFVISGAVILSYAGIILFVPLKKHRKNR